MRKILFHILNAIIPFPCVVCGGATSKSLEDQFCDECLCLMPQNEGLLCPMCGGILDSACEMCGSCLKQPMRPWVQAISIFQHKERVRVLMHQFKYRKRIEFGRVFGKMMSDKINILEERPDNIVPISMPFIRKVIRGYNQSEILARYLSKNSKIPLIYALKRPPWIRSQTHKDKKLRLKQLKNTFFVKNDLLIKDKHLLLVDDVFTTGATLHVAAQSLLNAGARKISVITVSRR